MADAPEFARPVELSRLGRGGASLTIAAEPDERAKLARRFSLESLDRLEAELRLEPLPGGLIRLSARLSAEVVQACIVTLEPVPSRIEEQFTLLYGAVAEPREITLAGEDEIIEPLAGSTIDVGEAVAQQLCLALDPYPRAPGWEAALAASAAEPLAESPFAVLKRRKGGATED